MARRDWDSLSDNYRKRLERHGITREHYRRGASLSAARGHKNTPERPLDQSATVPRKYERWYNERYNRPILMLTDEGEKWLVGVPRNQRSMIGSHWNATRSYLFNTPMPKARFWTGNTLDNLNFFKGKYVTAAELEAGGNVHAVKRHGFMVEPESVEQWTQSDTIDFDNVYSEAS
ncbi:hypothetical protein ACFWY9_30530 [Amycolatopsis sp. NPDC059027]|uniref:hypothetical protein n=1 Tax=Amycolatopsis sp. NPDC059027 TaxID=3346709 RepID=UPI00366BDDE1